MKVIEFPRELADALVPAVAACIEIISAMSHGEKIHAVCLYCPTGCTSVAVCARVLNQVRGSGSGSDNEFDTDFFHLTNPSEWGCVISDPHIFFRTNRLIDEFYEILFDGEFEDVTIEDSSTTDELQNFAENNLTQAFILSFLSMKEAGYFKGQAFADDVLVGLQFADPTKNDAALIERVSEKVNSEAWHSRVKNFCDILVHEDSSKK